jgi:hypothetical protein
MGMFGESQCTYYEETQVGTEDSGLRLSGVLHCGALLENIFPMQDIHSISRFSTEVTPKPTAPVEFSEQPVENEEILKKDDSEAPRRSKR